MNSSTTDALLRHGDFVRALARRLVTDESRIDDVVQETWLAALRSPPRAGWPLRGWLAGVARNVALKSMREESRRRRREQRVAQPEPARPTADVVAGEALRREVVQAVLAIDEPFRSALLLRYYDGLRPREIARRLSIPASTVRSRLQRGLDRLRGQLDERPGGRRAWALALVPLAATAPATAAATTLVLLGATGMKLKLLFGLLALLAVTGLVLLARSDPPERSASKPPPAAVEAPKEPAAPADAAPAPPVAETASGIRLDCTVHAPAGPVTLKVTGAGGSASVDEVVASGTHGLDVGALFEEGPPAELEVRATHADCSDVTERLPVTLDPDSLEPRLGRVELTLAPAAFATGSVRDERGALVAGTTIALFRWRDGRPAERAIASVEAGEGIFRLRAAEAGRYLVVAAHPQYRPRARQVSLEVGESVALPDFVLARGLSIRGRVTRTGGRAIERATLFVARGGPGLPLEVPIRDLRLLWADDGIEHVGIITRSDGEGNYEVSGLGSHPYAVACVSVPNGHGGALRNTQKMATAPATGVDFELEFVAIRLTVRHGGEPVAGADVTVTDIRSAGLYSNQYTSDGDGRLLVRGRPGADFRIVVEKQGFVPARLTFVAPENGEEVTHVVDLERARDRARLLVTPAPEGTRPLPPLPARFGFELKRLDAEQEPTRRTATTRDGTLLLADLAPGRYRLRTYPGGFQAEQRGFYLDASDEIQLSAGADTETRVALRAGGKLTVLLRAANGRTDISANCTLTDPAGKLLHARFVKFNEGGTGPSRVTYANVLPDMKGISHLLGALPPGRYGLEVEVPGRPGDSLERSLRIEAGRTTAVTLTLDGDAPD